MIEVLIHPLPHSRGLPLPFYATSGSAGLDLQAAIEDAVLLGPMERKLIPAGFSLVLPSGHEAQIRPRSGLALKAGITCLNSPGTIDSDYRGEVKILLVNFGQDDFTIERGDRIAQMVIAPVNQVRLRVEENMEGKYKTERGKGGFASTGVKSRSASDPEA